MSRLHVWWTITRKCCCGHVRTDHEHYRRGTNCGQCMCENYQWRMLKWVY